MSDIGDQKPSLDELDSSSQQIDPITPVKPKGAKILLTIAAPDGQEIQISQKTTATFAKLFNTAIDRFGLDSQQVRFLHEGTRLLPTDTPETRELEAGDTIDIQVQQIGGGH